MSKRILNVGYLLLLLLIFCASGVSAQKADTSSVEWVKIYFNMPADHSVAKQNNAAKDEADLLQTLIDLIDSAQYSIDLAVYDLENGKVGEALVRAAERSVRVRVATDFYNR